MDRIVKWPLYKKSTDTDEARRPITRSLHHNLLEGTSKEVTQTPNDELVYATSTVATAEILTRPVEKQVYTPTLNQKKKGNKFNSAASATQQT